MASKEDFNGLLPDNFEEFRSVKFWDGFFKARQQKAFEWYGEWKQLRKLVLPVIKDRKKVLVVGCGNSELSADM
jgi:predicted NUDIX family phosphoesterase